MPLHMPRVGTLDALRYLVNKAVPENLVLHLFTNDTVPSDGDTEASYDEATFPGYKPVVLTGANWSVTETHAECAALVFARSEPGMVEKVYGYYLTRARSGRIAWAERFEQAPVPMMHAHDRVSVAPRISARALV